MGRFQKALVKGRRAVYWLYSDDCLVLRSHDLLVEIKVPTTDLTDDDRMRAHYDRVTKLGEVGAVYELREIADRARA